ncbi:MAG: type IX secretion system membrane protein PorP/SprF [Cryomorphaceae bacterium]|nr:type IX secretion system membrane protein PorP/SprF [Cryomorphaceae bacterium]
MKRRMTILTGLLLMFSVVGFGQQLARRSQFINNTYLLNPAVAGTKVYSPIYASYRNQWTGFDGAPVTYYLNGHTQLPNKIGVGGILFHDNSGGAISRTGLEATGAYSFDLNNEDAVSFGLSAVFTQFAFDGTDLTAYDKNDQVLLGNRETAMNFDATFGMMVYGQNYFFGFSIPQLIQTNIGIEGYLTNKNENIRHYNFMGSYFYDINSDWSFQPAVLAKFTGRTPVQMDVLLKGVYKELAWAGFTYRHADAVVFSAGIDYLNYAFGYSYDITTSNASSFSPHSHELSVGYKIDRKRGKFRSQSLGKRRVPRKRLVK